MGLKSFLSRLTKTQSTQNWGKNGKKYGGKNTPKSQASSSVLCLYTVRDALVFVFFWLVVSFVFWLTGRKCLYFGC